jgi:hypothetical protein
VPIKRQENVVQFQVTVDDAVLVEVLQSQTHLGSVKLRSLGAKLSALDVQHEITTADVLHDEVHPGLRLETGVEIEQERVAFLVRDEEHPLLGPYALYLVIFYDEFLLENFDRVQLLCGLGLGQHDLAKVTFSENSKEVEVIEPNAAARALSGRRRYRLLRLRGLLRMMDDGMLRCRDFRNWLTVLRRLLLVLSNMLRTLLVLWMTLRRLLRESTVVRDVILRIVRWPLRLLLLHLLLRWRLLRLWPLLLRL